MREIKFRAYINNPIHGQGIFPVKSINFEPFVCEVVIGDEIVSFLISTISNSLNTQV